MLTRSIARGPAAMLEYALIFLLLFISLIYLSENMEVKKKNTLYFLAFLLYFLVHAVVTIFLRSYELQMPLLDMLYYNFTEFRLSTIGYFLPLVFIPIQNINLEKFEKFLVTLLKISIIYSIFEQVLSLLGFRNLFEFLYQNTGAMKLEDDLRNEIGNRSLGMYRILGFIGSPQLLGVFHLIGFVYMLQQRDKFWSYLAILAVFLSTSKTAIVSAIIIMFIYFIHKRKYLLFFASTFITLSIVIFSFQFYFHIVEYPSGQYDYPLFTHFMGSLYGYLLLLVNTAEFGSPTGFIEGGPLQKFIAYFAHNPLEVFFGKGPTYAIGFQAVINTKIEKYYYLGADFYFLSFIEQYGIIGFALLVYIFLYYPLKKIIFSSSSMYFYYIPIVLFLAMFHYPPVISKLIMIFAAYPIWKIYLQPSIDKKLTEKMI